MSNFHITKQKLLKEFEDVFLYLDKSEDEPDYSKETKAKGTTDDHLKKTGQDMSSSTVNGGPRIVMSPVGQYSMYGTPMGVFEEDEENKDEELIKNQKEPLKDKKENKQIKKESLFLTKRELDEMLSKKNETSDILEREIELEEEKKKKVEILLNNLCKKYGISRKQLKKYI